MGEAAKKDDDEQVIPVGPGAEGLDTSEKDEKEEKQPPEDARLAHGQDEAEVALAEGQKRKETSRERRERAKKARDRERLEYNFLLKRNEDLEKRLMRIEGRTAENEKAGIDQRIGTLDSQIASAERLLGEAMKKPNGSGSEEFTEALRIRDQLRDQRAQLTAAKQAQERQAERAERDPEAPVAAAPPRPDPRVIRHAREWAKQHEWFDFGGQDEDSVIVRAIDESISGEGFDPTTPEYWEELTERVKRRLPEKFRKGAQARPDEDDEDLDDDEDERPKKSGPKFSSGGRERPLKKGEVYVSAERKQAMKDYGVWDDPVARNRMLKKYQKWDAEFSASNRS